MSWVKNISLNTKLMGAQIITMVVVVVLCAALYTWIDYRSFKLKNESNLNSVSNILSSNLISPLLFDDADNVLEVISSVDFDESITNVVVLAEDEIVAQYNRDGRSQLKTPFLTALNDKVSYFDNIVTYKQSIVFENEKIGSLVLISNMSDLQSHFWERALYTLWVVLLGGSVAVALAIILQTQITKPIIDVQKTIAEVIKKEDFSKRTPVTGADEIGKISDSFNRLIELVENNTIALGNINRDLEIRVEERTLQLKDKNEKLLLATEKAELSRKEKEEFLASMSHEIRTPLNAIIGFSQLFKGTELTTEQEEYLQAIIFAGKNLLFLVNDILDLSKIEAGKFNFVSNPFELESTVKAVLDLMAFKAQFLHNEIDYKIDPAIPSRIVGDENRLTQILINLISNANKFTENGRILLDIELISETNNEVELQFCVEDNGIGIPENEIERIFDRFTQGADLDNMKYEGTGLGLPIVKEIIELLGGKIWVESTHGKGSKFFFKVNFLKLNKEGVAIEKNVREGLPDHDLSGKRILVVEDILFNQKLIKNVLQNWGVNIAIASNGKKAIELIVNDKFDLILMDIQMPVMNGYDTTKWIRAHENKEISEIPIIALTAHASHAESSKCFDLGMNGYMSKPFQFDQLKNAIAELIFNRKNTSADIDRLKYVTESYDLRRLLDNADGDNSFVLELMNDFIEVVPDKLEELHQSILYLNYDGIRRTAHALKGILATFGMKKGLDILNRVSEVAKVEGSSIDLKNLYGQLKNEVALIIDDFKEELK